MQLAMYGPGREMLQKTPEVLDALHMLVDKTLAVEAKRSAEGALMALDPPEVVPPADVDQLHVMMSCTFFHLLWNLISVTDGACACAQTSGRRRRL